MNDLYLINSAEIRSYVKNLPKYSIVKCKCSFCEQYFEVSREILLRDFLKKGNKVTFRKFCSKLCAVNSKSRKQELSCKWCKKIFFKKLNQISENNFCSKSCAASYNNTHKTHGVRRSKMEIFFEELIKINYPYIKYSVNDKTIIGSELDFYFPDLKFAIELNGIFHYEPIYGEKKFEQIQNNDKQKLIRCYEKGIELCIVDISSVSYFSKNVQEKYKKLFIELINKLIQRLE